MQGASQSISFLHAVLFFLIVSASCQKTSNERHPSVKILNPTANTAIYIDSIVIEFEVSDDERIEYIQAGISDENAVAVVASQVVYPKSRDTIVKFVFWPDKSKIRDRIEAFAKVSNGNKEHKVFVPIVYLPDIKIEINFITANSKTTGMDFRRWSEKGDLIGSFHSNDYHASEMIAFAWKKELFLRTIHPSEIIAISSLNGNRVWTFDQSVYPYKQFLSFSTGNALLWVADKSGIIYGIAPASGMISLVSTLQADTAAYLLREEKPYLFAAQSSSNGKHFFSVFYSATAQRFFTEEVNGEITAICPQKNNKVLLVQRNFDASQIVEFDPETFQFKNLIHFDHLFISSAFVMNDDQLIVIAKGALMRIDINDNEIQSIDPVKKFGQLIAGLDNQVFYAVGDRTICVVNSSGNIIDELTLNGMFDLLSVIQKIE